MKPSRLENFGGYLKARALFDLWLVDMETITDRRCERLVTQQLASADSICANIEEGYGRGSRREFCQFLRIAPGSARETRGRYERLGHWLAPEVVAARLALGDEVIAILTATILKLR